MLLSYQIVNLLEELYHKNLSELSSNENLQTKLIITINNKTNKMVHLNVIVDNIISSNIFNVICILCA